MFIRFRFVPFDILDTLAFVSLEGAFVVRTSPSALVYALKCLREY